MDRGGIVGQFGQFGVGVRSMMSGLGAEPLEVSGHLVQCLAQAASGPLSSHLLALVSLVFLIMTEVLYMFLCLRMRRQVGSLFI